MRTMTRVGALHNPCGCVDYWRTLHSGDCACPRIPGGRSAQCAVCAGCKACRLYDDRIVPEGALRIVDRAPVGRV